MNLLDRITTAAVAFEERHGVKAYAVRLCAIDAAELRALVPPIEGGSSATYEVRRIAGLEIQTDARLEVSRVVGLAHVELGA